MFWLRTAYADTAACWKGVRSDDRCQTLDKFKYSWPCWQHNSTGTNAGIAPFKLNLDKREGEWSAPRYICLRVGGRTPWWKLNKKLGGLLPVWVLWRRTNVFPPHRTRSRLLVRAVQRLVTLPTELFSAFRNRTIVPTCSEDSEHCCELILYPRTVHPNEDDIRLRTGWPYVPNAYVTTTLLRCSLCKLRFPTGSPVLDSPHPKPGFVCVGGLHIPQRVPPASAISDYTPRRQRQIV